MDVEQGWVSAVECRLFLAALLSASEIRLAIIQAELGNWLHTEMMQRQGRVGNK